MDRRFSKPAVERPQTKKEDPRVGSLLGQELSAGTKAAIVGFPTDIGVTRNGGRRGAADGPDAFRKAFYKLTPDARNIEKFTTLLTQVVDLGNFQTTEDLDRDQALFGQEISRLLADGIVPIVIGGGHEVAYGHFLGYAKNGIGVSIVNFDSHPDVRPTNDGKAHSGSPFWQALSHPECPAKRYEVLGLGPHVVAGSHVEFVTKSGGKVWFRDEVNSGLIKEVFSGKKDPVLVSFDLDGLDSSLAPGVSSPTVGGLSLDLWLDAAKRAGATEAVKSMDVVELNPAVDCDNQTARVAALTVWNFLAGMVTRS